MVYFGRLLPRAFQKGSLKSEILPPLALVLLSEVDVSARAIEAREAPMSATYAKRRR
jgi:hypothetical protein